MAPTANRSSAGWLGASDRARAPRGWPESGAVAMQFKRPAAGIQMAEPDAACYRFCFVDLMLPIVRDRPGAPEPRENFAGQHFAADWQGRAPCRFTGVGCNSRMIGQSFASGFQPSRPAIEAAFRRSPILPQCGGRQELASRDSFEPRGRDQGGQFNKIASKHEPTRGWRRSRTRNRAAANACRAASGEQGALLSPPPREPEGTKALAAGGVGDSLG